MTPENTVLVVFLLLPMLCAAALYLFFVKYRQHQKHTHRALRLAAGNLLVFLAITSLLVAAGEGYYRFWYDETDSFGLVKTTVRWFHRYYHPNNLGYRDSVDYADRRDPAKRRITFVGDSFTVGHGVKNVEDRFANLIRHQHPGWEIHVLAKNGLFSTTEYDLLTSLPESYEFDILVLVYFLNDISGVLPELPEIFHRIYQEIRPGPVAQHSYLFNTLYYRIVALTDPDISDYYAFTRKAYYGSPWRQQSELLTRMKAVVEERRGRLLVVTFPFFHRLGDNYEYAPVHEKLNEFWRRLLVPHLDLLETFRGMAPGTLMVNHWDPHPNEHAHRLAARAIARFLERELGG